MRQNPPDWMREALDLNPEESCWSAISSVFTDEDGEPNYARMKWEEILERMDSSRQECQLYDYLVDFYFEIGTRSNLLLGLWFINTSSGLSWSVLVNDVQESQFQDIVTHIKQWREQYSKRYLSIDRYVPHNT